ncbi:MAG: hypothetical protein HYZ34_12965, partial [Ignavibacteriae bacterium]|nr:hypothetical protein [Ignavibacteriota bacterium]
VHQSNIEKLLTSNLAELRENKLLLTDNGFLLCDSIAESLLVQPQAALVACK